MEKNVKISLLLDFYGSLLSQKQARATELYYNDDLSLAEVADELRITRQGARDLITRAGAALAEYEEALGLLERYNKFQRGLESIGKNAREIKRISENENIAGLAQNIINTAALLAETDA